MAVKLQYRESGNCAEVIARGSLRASSTKCLSLISFSFLSLDKCSASQPLPPSLCASASSQKQLSRPSFVSPQSSRNFRRHSLLEDTVDNQGYLCSPRAARKLAFSILHAGLVSSEKSMQIFKERLKQRSGKIESRIVQMNAFKNGDDYLSNEDGDPSAQELRVPDHLLPKVAIVGRPNVGKSALFNRLVGGDLAIVNDEPGVTRDRLYGRGFWGLQEFMVVDTGGLLSVPKSESIGMDGIAITSGGGQNAVTLAVREACMAGLPAMIERQAAAAIEDASAVIFVVDGQAGVTSIDEDIAIWLRKKHSDKPIILAVNKCESPTKGFQQATEFWSLGFEPVRVSAISGIGTGELLDSLCSALASFKVEEVLEEEENRVPAIAIIGKPNVGKSSILNALVGEERSIVSPISGTTRDAIDTEITGPDGKVYRLIDTAGIRRRAAVAAAGSKTEGLSVNRAFRAIRRADVVALVIDAMACVTEQDWKLAERIVDEGKGCVIVVNKWDTVPEKNNKTTIHYEQDVREKLRGLEWAPIVYTSALASKKPMKILEAAIEVENERSRRLTTALLNQVVHEAMALNPPPRTRGGKKGRLYYCTQAAVRPPTFVFFVNEAKLFSDVYRRYMEKQVRANVGYRGTPIRLLWRSKKKSEQDAAAKEAATVGSG